MIFIIISTLIALLIASYTDIKTTEIPLWLFPCLFAVQLTYFFITKEKLFTHLIALAITCFLFFIYAMFLGGGGGDIFMASAVAFGFGMRYFLWILLITYLSFLLFIIIKMPKKKTEIPFAPFMLIGTLITSVILIV